VNAGPVVGRRFEYAPPGFAHTSYGLLNHDIALTSPPSDLWREHREWFWPRGDGDDKTYGQLCWGNASMVAFMIGRIRQDLGSWVTSAPGTYSIMSISINDNGKMCEDANELAINAMEGTSGGALFRAVNTIAANVSGTFPGIEFSTMAYAFAVEPPKLIKVMHLAVIVRMCSIDLNFA
jgi:hypothetical protein